ncbi:NAD(P)H:quinone oxidoreductase [Actinomadura kijaniata]|uniref:NAD(P)H:quinone oxidoreductase n=1 Tax=Actinomadura kijaniata TaxID=46161 RepID=UPI000832E174|nr:NAD(P)H:quinone oxidoreductase [Actinomadura kijaniata]
MSVERPVRVAVVYYSATGTVFALAKAAATAAEKAGAEVRLRRVRELAPDEAIASNQGWAENAAATQHVVEASLDDLEWADVILFGAPTRFGLPAAQLKQFIDTAGGLWARGKLVDKVVSSFTSTATAHGGQESTILAINNTFYHWGAIIVPPGYADPVQFQMGNPYGTSHVSNNGEVGPGEVELAAIGFQTTRAVEVAAALKAGRYALETS